MRERIYTLLKLNTRTNNEFGRSHIDIYNLYILYIFKSC